MLKAIFWDNDGVLVDTEKLYFTANKEILESIGIVLTKEVYIDSFLRKGTGAWHLAEKMGFTQNQVKDLRAARNEIYTRLLLKEEIYLNGINQILEELSKSYIMGIVTSSRKEHFDIIHRSTNILQYFDFILTGEDYTKYKPDPQPYLLALERSKLKNDECLVIEDSERGLASALAAGLKCIVIPNELTRICSFHGAYKVLDNFNELLPAIKNFNNTSPL